MQSTHLARQARRPRRHRPRPVDPGTDRRHRPDHLAPASAAPTCTSTRCWARSSTPGDILGHEPMGVVEEVGPEVTELQVGDRVVVPFNISCGTCFMCDARSALAVRDHAGARAGQGRRAVRLHQALRPGARRPGRVPAGAVRQHARSRCPDGPPDDRFVYLSDVLPTAWQAVEYADVPPGGTLAVLGPRPDRRHGRPDRPAPRRRAGDRHRPGAGAAGAGPRARRRDDRPRRARRRPGRRGPRADRRPRPRLRDRRRRHGGPRLRRSARLAHQTHRAAAGRGGREADGDAPASTG